MVHVRLILFFAFTLAINAQNASFPICNPSLPSYDRATDLGSRMNVSEQISQMVNTAIAILRLGLPAFQWWSEALHGVAGSPGVHFGGDLPVASSFPMPINLGATFNLSLVHRMVTVISIETCAFNNEGRAGLVFFTSNINIFRDPRWGRGEDPFLTSQYAYALIHGLQNSDDERDLKIAADCKHYAAYDLENWHGVDRFHFNAIVSDQDLLERYLPPFETCIRDAKVASIMCSYNAVNGVPSCGNQFLLQIIARKSYHLDGFVVSNCGAVGVLETHNYTQTPEATVTAALHTGTDLECGDFYVNHAQSALNNGTIVESDIDQALKRAFNVPVRLGYFDPPEQQPYRQSSSVDVDTSSLRQLTLEAAQQSIVLLKNNNKALPLNLNELQNKKFAFIEPTADATGLIQGSYHVIAPYLISPLETFQNLTQGLSVNVSFAHGCNINDTDQSGFSEAIQLARSADIVLTEPGLSVIVEAILSARKIFQCMRNYSVFATSTTVNILVTYTVLLIAFRYDFPSFMVLVITFFNNTSLMAVSKDRIQPSPHPVKWLLSDVFAHATVYGIFSALSTIIFFVVITQTSFFFDRFGVDPIPYHPANSSTPGWNDPVLSSIVYLQSSIQGHAVIFITRTRGFFFLDRPSLTIIIPFIVAQLSATFIAVYANWSFTNIAACGWKWAGIIWVWNIIWFFPFDLLKFALAAYFEPKGRLAIEEFLESKPTTPQHSLSRHSSKTIRNQTISSLPRCLSTHTYERHDTTEGSIFDITAKYFSPYTNEITTLYGPNKRYAQIYSTNNDNLRRVATAPDDLRRFALAETRFTSRLLKTPSKQLDHQTTRI